MSFFSSSSSFSSYSSNGGEPVVQGETRTQSGTVDENGRVTLTQDERIPLGGDTSSLESGNTSTNNRIESSEGRFEELDDAEDQSKQA